MLTLPNLLQIAHTPYNQWMHIGIDCRLPTYRMGGISQYTIHLIRALGELETGDDYTILHSRREKGDFRPGKAKVFSRSDLWTPCHHRLERYTLGSELIRHLLDLLHSPDFIPPAFGARRRVITVHDLNFVYYPEFLTAESRRYYAGQIEWAVDVADHIISDSEATRNDLIDLLKVPPDRVTTIHLAASPVYSASYTPAEIQATVEVLGTGEEFIMGVGTLEPRKNWPMLIEAYAQLRKDHSVTVPLVLIGGKGWLYEDVFKTISRFELHNHVMHLSGVSDIQLAHLYHAAGVLAFPSHTEGFGLPALEAMHAGCPVVASNRGSLPEVVGDAAILLEPTDVSGWVRSLSKVLADRELARSLSKAGLEQAKKFTWRKTAMATSDVYHRAMAS